MRRILRTSLASCPILSPNLKAWVVFVTLWLLNWLWWTEHGTTFRSRQLIKVRPVYRKTPNQSSAGRVRTRLWNWRNVRNVDPQSSVIMWAAEVGSDQGYLDHNRVPEEADWQRLISSGAGSVLAGKLRSRPEAVFHENRTTIRSLLTLVRLWWTCVRLLHLPEPGLATSLAMPSTTEETILHPAQTESRHGPNLPKFWFRT